MRREELGETEGKVGERERRTVVRKIEEHRRSTPEQRGTAPPSGEIEKFRFLQ